MSFEGWNNASNPPVLRCVCNHTYYEHYVGYSGDRSCSNCKCKWWTQTSQRGSSKSGKSKD